MKRLLLSFILLLSFSICATAQVTGATIQIGTLASRPASGGLYFVTDDGAQRFTYWNGTIWKDIAPGLTSSGAMPTTMYQPVPAGAIVFISSGSCPAGFTEDATLVGKYLLLTKNANGDVGTTGGSATLTATGSLSSGSAGTPEGSVASPVFVGTLASLTHSGSAVADHSFTPAGTVAWPAGVPAFTGSAGTVPAQTFTGSSATTSAVSGGTPAGTVSQPTFTGNAVVAASTNSGTKLVTGNTSTGVSPVTTATGTVSQPTFTGSALATHTHTLTATGTNSTASFTPAGTVAWPAGVPTLTGTLATLTHTVTQPSAHSYTPAGTISSPAFTGSALAGHTHSFTGSAVINSPSFVKMIPCRKD